MRLFRSLPAKAPLPEPTANSIEIDRKVLNETNFHMTVEGTGNYLRVARPQAAGDVRVHLGGNARVTIGPDCVLGDLVVFAGVGATVEIGVGVGFSGRSRILSHEPQNIFIGDGCLFGAEVDVFASDMHSILDAKTGKRINPAKGIHISDRVWVGRRASVLKGVTIGPDSVIATGAIVVKDIPAGCVAAGNPATVIRRGVTWQRELA
jgi:acetyltransferase-like isoleucine patch superfamily enzyme